MATIIADFRRAKTINIFGSSKRSSRVLEDHRKISRNYPGRLRAPMPSAFTAFLGKG